MRCPLVKSLTDAYGKYGMDRQRVCLVVCRPDQHVGCALGLGDFDGLGDILKESWSR